MVFINKQSVQMGSTAQETLDNIYKVTREQEIVIIDEHGQPMDKERILHMLQTVDTRFQAVPVNELERDAIESTLNYLDNAVRQIPALVETDDIQYLFREFADFIEALLHLNRLGDYFGIKDISGEKVSSLANRALAQIQLNNDSYIRELLEYECLPLIEDFQRSLYERKPV